MAAEQGRAVPHPPAGHLREIFPPAGGETEGGRKHVEILITLQSTPPHQPARLTYYTTLLRWANWPKPVLTASASSPERVTPDRGQLLTPPPCFMLSRCLTHPSHSFSKHSLKYCREGKEIFPAPPDRSETWMLAWPFSPRGDRSANDQQLKDDAGVRVPRKRWAARKGWQIPAQPSLFLWVKPHSQIQPAASHLQHKELHNQRIQIWSLQSLK